MPSTRIRRSHGSLHLRRNQQLEQDEEDISASLRLRRNLKKVVHCLVPSRMPTSRWDTTSTSTTTDVAENVKLRKEIVENLIVQEVKKNVTVAKAKLSKKQQKQNKRKESKSKQRTSTNSVANLTTATQQKPPPPPRERTIDSSRDVCPICWDGFHLGEKVCWSKNTQCSHGFHLDCMVVWLEGHDKCPICRSQYLPEIRK